MRAAPSYVAAINYPPVPRGGYFVPVPILSLLLAHITLSLGLSIHRLTEGIFCWLAEN
jgi:hypothetical protein